MAAARASYQQPSTTTAWRSSPESARISISSSSSLWSPTELAKATSACSA